MARAARLAEGVAAGAPEASLEPGLAAGDALRLGRLALAAPGSLVRDDSPALDAEVLLREVLGLTRAGLLTHPERPLTESQARTYLDALRRRAAGEPVAYILGRREFMGLAFHVDRRALIPRPETEALVEVALRTAAGSDTSAVEVADVGTGSGAIAISLARRRPKWRILATDVSEAALDVARANAGRLLGAGQVQVVFLHGSLLQPVAGPLRLIAANLPYIPTGDLATLPPPVRDFEPRQALDGGQDGLDAYRALLPQAAGKLEPGGTLLMECDPRQAQPLCGLAARAFPSAGVAVHRDLAGRERVVEVHAR